MDNSTVLEWFRVVHALIYLRKTISTVSSRISLCCFLVVSFHAWCTKYPGICPEARALKSLIIAWSWLFDDLFVQYKACQCPGDHRFLIEAWILHRNVENGYLRREVEIYKDFPRFPTILQLGAMVYYWRSGIGTWWKEYIIPKWETVLSVPLYKPTRNGKPSI